MAKTINEQQLRNLIKKTINEQEKKHDTVRLVEIDGKPAIVIPIYYGPAYQEIYVFIDLKKPAIHSMDTDFYKTKSDLTSAELAHMIKLLKY